MENVYQNEEKSTSEVNPWTTIWYAPRRAIRSVMEHKTPAFVMILAIIVGITNFLDRAIGKNLGDTMALPAILLLAVVGGAISGLISLVLLSSIMTLVGKWFGGKGTYAEMKMAVGAAYIPAALTIGLYILDILFLGSRLFADVSITTFQTLWLLLSAFITMILSSWSIFLTVKGVAEAHRFSAWKGLITLLIPAAAVFIFLIIIGSILFML